MDVISRIKSIINDQSFRDFAESQTGFVKKCTIDENKKEVRITNAKGDTHIFTFSDFIEFGQWYGGSK